MRRHQLTHMIVRRYGVGVAVAAITLVPLLAGCSGQSDTTPDGTVKTVSPGRLERSAGLQVKVLDVAEQTLMEFKDQTSRTAAPDGQKYVIAVLEVEDVLNQSLSGGTIDPVCATPLSVALIDTQGQSFAPIPDLDRVDANPDCGETRTYYPVHYVFLVPAEVTPQAVQWSSNLPYDGARPTIQVPVSMARSR